MKKKFEIGDSQVPLYIENKEGTNLLCISYGGERLLLHTTELPGLKKALNEMAKLIKREPFYLWQGNNGTFIDKLTKESDLPRIHVGGGGKVEKFTKIGPPIYKTEGGGFEQA